MAITKSSGGTTVAVIGLGLAVPFLYVLSIGPFLWLFTRGYVNVRCANAAQVVYWPLEKVGDVAPPAGRAIEAYGRLWIAEPTLLGRPIAPPTSPAPSPPSKR